MEAEAGRWSTRPSKPTPKGRRRGGVGGFPRKLPLIQKFSVDASPPPIMADRSHPDSAVGNATIDRCRGIDRASHRVSGRLISRTPNMSARSGRNAAREVIGNACRAAGNQRSDDSRRCLRKQCQQTLDLRRERSKLRFCRSRFEMNDHIHSQQPISSSEAAKDLANLPLEAMTYHGFADLAAGGDSEPGFRRLIGMKVDRRQRPVSFPAEPVATNKIRTPA